MVDPQKEALYAEKTRRAGLYAQMFLLQRNGAPHDQLDAIVASIGSSESEIARMSDEVNDAVWYKNYVKVLDGYGEAVDLLKSQGATREQENKEIKTLVGESVSETKKLADTVGGLGDALTATIGRIDSVEETVSEHGTQLDAHAKRMGQIEGHVVDLQTEVRAKFKEIEREISALTQQQSMFRKWLEANPPPAALQKKSDAKR